MSCSKEEEFKLGVEVIPPSPETTKEVIISWTPPVEYEKGDPLPIDEIGGYVIYCGPLEYKYSLIFDVTDNYTMEYTLPKLDPNTYYCVITAYTLRHLESDYSNEVIFEVK